MRASGINGDCRVIVTGMDGKILLYEKIHTNGAGAEKDIDVSGLKAGTYIVQLETLSSVLTRYMIIQ